MLPAQYRLRKDQEIGKVFKKGRSVYSQFLGLRILPNNLKNSRFCFVVSNKISKKSSKRNLLKRRLRAIIHSNLAKIKGNYDIIILVKPDKAVLEKKYLELTENLLNLLKKARLF
jgi:ribonuclease P protein component